MGGGAALVDGRRRGCSRRSRLSRYGSAVDRQRRISLSTGRREDPEGLLIAAGIGFRRVHDLDELADLAVPLFPRLAADLDACRPFTAWATEYRYPSDDDAPPKGEEVREAVRVLERALRGVGGPAE